MASPTRPRITELSVRFMAPFAAFVAATAEDPRARETVSVSDASDAECSIVSIVCIADDPDPSSPEVLRRLRLAVLLGALEKMSREVTPRIKSFMEATDPTEDCFPFFDIASA